MSEPDDTTDQPITPAGGEPASEEGEPVPSPERVWDADELADEMSKESFPTSDPPSTWGGDDRG